MYSDSIHLTLAPSGPAAKAAFFFLFSAGRFLFGKPFMIAFFGVMPFMFRL